MHQITVSVQKSECGSSERSMIACDANVWLDTDEAVIARFLARLFVAAGVLRLVLYY